MFKGGQRLESQERSPQVRSFGFRGNLGNRYQEHLMIVGKGKSIVGLYKEMLLLQSNALLEAKVYDDACCHSLRWLFQLYTENFLHFDVEEGYDGLVGIKKWKVKRGEGEESKGAGEEGVRATVYEKHMLPNVLLCWDSYFMPGEPQFSKFVRSKVEKGSKVTEEEVAKREGYLQEEEVNRRNKEEWKEQIARIEYLLRLTQLEEEQNLHQLEEGELHQAFPENEVYDASFPENEVYDASFPGTEEFPQAFAEAEVVQQGFPEAVPEAEEFEDDFQRKRRRVDETLGEGSLAGGGIVPEGVDLHLGDKQEHEFLVRPMKGCKKIEVSNVKTLHWWWQVNLALLLTAANMSGVALLPVDIIRLIEEGKLPYFDIPVNASPQMYGLKQFQTLTHGNTNLTFPGYKKQDPLQKWRLEQPMEKSWEEIERGREKERGLVAKLGEVLKELTRVESMESNALAGSFGGFPGSMCQEPYGEVVLDPFSEVISQLKYALMRTRQTKRNVGKEIQQLLRGIFKEKFDKRVDVISESHPLLIPIFLPCQENMEDMTTRFLQLMNINWGRGALQPLQRKFPPFPTHLLIGRLITELRLKVEGEVGLYQLSLHLFQQYAGEKTAQFLLQKKLPEEKQHRFPKSILRTSGFQGEKKVTPTSRKEVFQDSQLFDFFGDSQPLLAGVFLLFGIKLLVQEEENDFTRYHLDLNQIKYGNRFFLKQHIEKVAGETYFRNSAFYSWNHFLQLELGEVGVRLERLRRKKKNNRLRYDSSTICGTSTSFQTFFKHREHLKRGRKVEFYTLQRAKAFHGIGYNNDFNAGEKLYDLLHQLQRFLFLSFHPYRFPSGPSSFHITP